MHNHQKFSPSGRGREGRCSKIASQQLSQRLTKTLRTWILWCGVCAYGVAVPLHAAGYVPVETIKLPCKVPGGCYEVEASGSETARDKYAPAGMGDAFCS